MLCIKESLFHYHRHSAWKPAARRRNNKYIYHMIYSINNTSGRRRKPFRCFNSRCCSTLDWLLPRGEQPVRDLSSWETSSSSSELEHLLTPIKSPFSLRGYGFIYILYICYDVMICYQLFKHQVFFMSKHEED